VSAYDVIVIGGGVNGLGTARDCAQRGLRVLVIEKSDFATGASGNNSGMIHGGVRYMLYDRSVTALACADAGYIRKIAPFLIFRIPFLMPLRSRHEVASLGEKVYWYATEVYVGTYDKYARLKGGKPSTRLSAEELYALEPALVPGLSGAITFDEWGIDSWRLCVLNALDAQRFGAQLRTWTEVREVIREGGRATGVRWRDAISGEVGEDRAPIVLNCAGAWSPELARRQGVTVRMRPGKGVHLTLDRRFSNYAIACTAVDGRQMFLMPHEHESVIGTTDDDSYSDPDDLEATDDEVRYLVEGAEALVPGVRRARIIRSWWGLRTTLWEYGRTEDELSREHELFEHSAEGAAGMLSFVGGKLASYRAQSEEIADRIVAMTGKNAGACRTHLLPLPGGEGEADIAALAKRYAMAEPIVERIVYRHGTLAEEILRLTADDPRLKAVLCRSEAIIAAEVVHCARHELVRRLSDLRHRCRLAVGACGGLDCARPAAQLVARELGWDGDRTRAELSHLLEIGWRERRAILDGPQLVAEEMLRGAHRGTAGL
jgi:glycerol-3-phosphate dehydrogenase